MADLVNMLGKAMDFLTAEQPRSGLHPIPGTKPINIEALVLPPVIYYIALLFLPPPPPQAVDTLSIKLLRSTLALIAGFLFFRMPLAYHIPQSVGLNYQLSLVGLYGGCRVLDAFFISPALFDHIPRRVRYEHRPRAESPPPAPSGTTETSGPEAPSTSQKRVGYADSKDVPSSWARRPSLPLDSYFPAKASSAAGTAVNAVSKTLSGPKKEPVYQFETPEDGWPHTFLDRASWALELELSMRGMGMIFTQNPHNLRESC